MTPTDKMIFIDEKLDHYILITGANTIGWKAIDIYDVFLGEQKIIKRDLDEWQVRKEYLEIICRNESALLRIIYNGGNIPPRLPNDPIIDEILAMYDAQLTTL